MPNTKAAYGHKRKPKVEIDGIKFMSPGESERYLEICIMKLKGEIQHFELQPKFEIQPKFRKCCGHIYTPPSNEVYPNVQEKLIFKKGICPQCREKMPVVHGITYTADFRIWYTPTRVVVEDVKGSGGYTTPVFETKKKLFEYRYPCLTLTILKRTGSQKNRDRLMAERAALK